MQLLQHACRGKSNLDVRASNCFLHRITKTALRRSSARAGIRTYEGRPSMSCLRGTGNVPRNRCMQRVRGKPRRR
jgi:hypothetical protein